MNPMSREELAESNVSESSNLLAHALWVTATDLLRRLDECMAANEVLAERLRLIKASATVADNAMRDLSAHCWYDSNGERYGFGRAGPKFHRNIGSES